MQFDPDRPQDKATWIMLLKMFSVSEMRRLIRFGVDGELLSNLLPGPIASPSDVATSIVMTLHNMDNDEKVVLRSFFSNVIETRPRRRDEIEKVAALWGLPHEEETDPVENVTRLKLNA